MTNARVNRAAWEALTPDQQREVEAALRQGGVIGARETLEPSDDAPLALLAEDRRGLRDDGTQASASCESECTAAYGSAVASCNGIRNAAGRAVCYGAATAAYGVCLKGC